jgi:hypothetical protein
MTLDVSTLAAVPRPHPVDRALSALDEAVALLVTSGRPSRFSEIHRLSRLASELARLRPAAGVDDVEPEDEGEMDGHPMPRRLRGLPRANDAVDMQRELMMIAQQMIKVYADQQKTRVVPETRINQTIECGNLMRLRVQLMKEDQLVPEEINVRIDQLLKQIGAPAHEPEPSFSVDDYLAAADDVRRHPPDGPGGPDGGGVGGPVADGGDGDEGDIAEVRPIAAAG